MRRKAVRMWAATMRSEFFPLTGTLTYDERVTRRLATELGLIGCGACVVPVEIRPARKAKAQKKVKRAQRTR